MTKHFYLFLYLVILITLIIFVYNIFLIPTNVNIIVNGEYIHDIRSEGGKIPSDRKLKKYQIPKTWNWCHISENDAKIWKNITGLNILEGNYCSIIKNQHMPKYCGSCYIFASISCLEERINIMNTVKYGKYKGKVRLSTQHVLNGLSKYQNRNTCKGGHVNHVMFFLMEHGVPDETCNPYTAESKSNMFEKPYCWTSAPFGKSCKDIGLKSYCHDSTKACCIVNDVKLYHVEGFKNIIHKNESHDEKVKNVKTEIFLNGPVTASINADPIEVLPRDNIVPNNSCSKHNINHIVRIIGWTHKNNIEVWIAANSWGTNWGNNGFFYIPIEKDCLGVLDYGFQAIFPKGWSTIM